MAIFVDPQNQTFLYTMHVESLKLASERTDLIGIPLECQWHTWGCKDCSPSFVVPGEEVTFIKYDTFFAVSFRNAADRSLVMRLSLVPSGNLKDSIGVAMLDLASFSQEESFRAHFVDFCNGSDVVATVKLFTASQPRWMVDAPVVQQAEGCFVDHHGDAQASYIRSYMAGQPLSDTATEKEQDGMSSAARRQQQPRSHGRPWVGRDDQVVDGAWRGFDSLLTGAKGAGEDPNGQLEAGDGSIGKSTTATSSGGTEGLLGRLGSMLGCAQEHITLVRHLQAACSPNVACECYTSRDAWEPDTREPAPPRTIVPEEPLDSVFRPPCVAAAVARHNATAAQLQKNKRVIL